MTPPEDPGRLSASTATNDYIPLEVGEGSGNEGAKGGRISRKRKLASRKRPRNGAATANRFAVLDVEDEEHEAHEGADPALENEDEQSQRKRQRSSLVSTSRPNIRDDATDEGGREQSKKTAKKGKPGLAFAPVHRVNSSLRIADLQNLALYCIADDSAPQWVAVSCHSQVRKAVVLLVPGLEMGMLTGDVPLTTKPEEVGGNKAQASADSAQADTEGFQRVGRNPDDFLPLMLKDQDLPISLHPLASIFDRAWPIKTPGDDKYSRIHSPIHAMLSCPLPKSRGDTPKKGPGPAPVTPSKDSDGTRTPITSFVATPEDLQESEYPLHPASVPAVDRPALFARREQTQQDGAHGWVDTSVAELDEGNVPEGEFTPGSLTAGRTVYSIDCEMCMAGEDFVLTRVSIVDWAGSTVLDELVKPDQPITNYLTAFSGITAEKLANVTTTLADIQQRLLQLFTPRTILVGHSLESDFRAMKLTHPFVVDTSLLYPHPRGPPLRSSLKWLAQKYLNKAIQQGHGSSGHDSVEDAQATLELVRQKCERGALWGSPAAQQESIFKRISRSRGRLEAGDSKGLGRTSGAIVDYGTPERSYAGMAPYYLGASDDADIVAGVKRAVQGDADGKYVPGGGVDFVWARLKALENVRNRPESMEAEVAATTANLRAIYETLPPCSLFVVYSGTGDARELFRLQDLQRQFRREYAVKKWDELSVQWTDSEDQALKRACEVARRGVGFVGMK